MKTNMPLLLLLAGLCCSGLQCRDSEDPYVPTLPPETQYGANTIGCMVGDRVLVPKPKQLDGYYFGISNDLYMYVQDEYGKVVIHFGNDVLNDTGYYDLTNSVSPVFKETYYVNFSKTGDKYYTTNTLHTGKLHIKKWDKQHRLIAGTFYFHAIAHDSQKVFVSNGRFDMKY